MAKKWGTIAAVHGKRRFQLPVRSALIKCRSIITIAMYCSQKLNNFDFTLLSLLKTVSREVTASMPFTTASQLCRIDTFSLKQCWHSWILAFKFCLSWVVTSAEMLLNINVFNMVPASHYQIKPGSFIRVTAMYVAFNLSVQSKNTSTAKQLQETF